MAPLVLPTYETISSSEATVFGMEPLPVKTELIGLAILYCAENTWGRLLTAPTLED